MKLMSMKQYSKMTKDSLVRKIMKALKKLPKTKLIKLCYELEKRRLPTISTTKRNMPRLTARRKAFQNYGESDMGMTLRERRISNTPIRRKKPRKTKAKRKLRAGTITKIKIKMANRKTRMQKVKVLSSGKYRFMKN